MDGNNVQVGLLNDKQAAAFLGVSPALLWKLRSAGTGPKFIRLGSKLVRYRVQDLQEWAATNVVGA